MVFQRVYGEQHEVIAAAALISHECHLQNISRKSSKREVKCIFMNGVSIVTLGYDVVVFLFLFFFSPE